MDEKIPLKNPIPLILQGKTVSGKIIDNDMIEIFVKLISQ